MNTFIRQARHGIADYADHLGCFSANARLYLVSAVISGASMGVFRFLLNFYALSKGYNNEFVGNLVTASSMTALLAALPMGYLADRLGRKTSLLIGGILSSLAVYGIVLFPSAAWVLIAMNVALGLAQSLSGVTMGPFLMENSQEKERTYLFSFSSGLGTLSGFVGNWIGGYLPTWSGAWQHAAPTSSSAYASALLVIASGALLAVLPLLLLKTRSMSQEERSTFAPLNYFFRNFKMLGRLVLPMLVTSIGAGLFMPFMNVFFRTVHHQPDPVIGTLFAWGSLAMGIGLLVAPPLADRYGKIQLVVITQAVSIPFLAMLGFSPWFGLSALAYYVRLSLMNMSGPVYQTFVMERVQPDMRATVASLVSMASNFGWAFSPTISGWLQVNYGFSPVFAAVMVLYLISVGLYWGFFWPKRTVRV
jgi:MFS family permease